MRLHIRFPHLDEIRSIPCFWGRLTHHRSWRHLRAFGLGILVMTIGSSISLYGGFLLHHLLADVIGYGLHGIGLIPFAIHAEAAWAIVTGE